MLSNSSATQGVQSLIYMNRSTWELQCSIFDEYLMMTMKSSSHKRGSIYITISGLASSIDLHIL